MTVLKRGRTRAVVEKKPLTNQAVYGAVIGWRRRTGVWPKWEELRDSFLAHTPDEVRFCIKTQPWRLEERTEAGADRIVATDVPMLLEERSMKVYQATPEDIARIDAALAAKPKPKAWGDYEVDEGRAAAARRRFVGQIAATKAAQRPGFVSAVAPLPVLPEPPQEKGDEPMPTRKLPAYGDLLREHEAGATAEELATRYGVKTSSVDFALSTARTARKTAGLEKPAAQTAAAIEAPKPEAGNDLPYQPLTALTPGTAITIPGGNRASAELLAQIAAAIQALGTGRVITPEIRIEIPA